MLLNVEIINICFEEKKKMKRYFKFITALGLFCGFAGLIDVTTNQTVEAQSFAQKNHLRPYTIPKKFRGTWHRGKSKLRITSHTIDGYRTYYPSNKLKTYKNPGKTFFVEKEGKTLVYYAPQSCGMGIYRQGKNLVSTSMGCKWVYHR